MLICLISYLSLQVAITGTDAASEPGSILEDLFHLLEVNVETRFLSGLLLFFVLLARFVDPTLSCVAICLPEFFSFSARHFGTQPLVHCFLSGLLNLTLGVVHF